MRADVVAAPRARLTADDTPPPMAPADIIWVSMANGNTRAIAASGTVPRMPTYRVSAIPTSTETVIAITLGTARRRRVGRILPVIRGLGGEAAVAGSMEMGRKCRAR